MKRSEGGKVAAVLSGLSLLVSIMALVLVCRFCCPEMGTKLRQLVGGLEGSPVRQAFSVMADGLGEGEPVGQTLRETVQVLFGAAD